MDNFQYFRVGSVEEACSVLSEYPDTEILSGGQSLLPRLRQRVGSPEYVLDINAIPDRAYVERDGDSIVIGCLTRYADIEESEMVREHCTVLAESVSEIGDKQVRNQGTLCGSIAHADPAGDPPVVATALGAEIEAESVDGTAVYDAETFFNGFFETELSENELVSEVRFPVLSPSMGAAYEKYETGEGAYPTATVAAVVEVDDGTVVDASVVVGAVETAPVVIDDAVDRLVGAAPDEEVINEAAELAGERIDPMPDTEGSVEFKTELVKTLGKRAIVAAVERAENES